MTGTPLTDFTTLFTWFSSATFTDIEAGVFTYAIQGDETNWATFETEVEDPITYTVTDYDV